MAAQVKIFVMCISRNKSIFFGLAYSFSPRTLIIIAFWKNILLLKLSNSSTPPTPSPTSVAFLFSGVVFFLSDIDSLSFPLIGHYRVFYSISENLIRNRLGGCLFICLSGFYFIYSSFCFGFYANMGFMAW